MSEKVPTEIREFAISPTVGVNSLSSDVSNPGRKVSSPKESLNTQKKLLLFSKINGDKDINSLDTILFNIVVFISCYFMSCLCDILQILNIKLIDNTTKTKEIREWISTRKIQLN